MRPRGLALAPFIVFAAFYAGLSLAAGDFYRVPMTIAFLAASATAVAMDFRRPMAERIETYARGMGEANVMTMCLIFVMSGAFASVARASGAVDAAVALAQAVMPARLMLAGVFLVSCLVSLAIGTSCGTIAAVAPIALGFAAPLRLPPALLAGAVVGGAMFGDNLSMISDTTIAATRTQGIRMRDKFIANACIAAPAALCALLAYAALGTSHAAAPAAEPATWRHALLVAPYLLILALALAGMNVMPLIFFGTLLASLIGVALGRFDFLGALDYLGKGTLAMSETLIVALLAGGLFRTVQAGGGIEWLTQRTARLVRGPRTCELCIFLLVATVNLFTANNTVAIVIAGPIARACSEQFRAAPARVASVLDTASCIVQGMIPYGAQILIVTGIAQGANISLGAFDLISGLYYQHFLLLAVLAAMAIPRRCGRRCRAPRAGACVPNDRRTPRTTSP
jgi:Na+/H+ antiporter NhaC